MNTLTPLLEEQRKWAERIEQEQPGFFNESAKGQAPEVLWIGCADSRVPANSVVNLPPGAMFVHRNIANVVTADDLNCASVIQYAVEALKVKHIVVCGHYGCGGVAASLNEPSLGRIEDWLDNIRAVYKANADEVEGIADPQAKQNRMCELNVVAQVGNVCSNPTVKAAWEAGQELSVHGWIYELASGRIKDLDVTASNP
jgi:carbonic anhydrase